MIIIKYLCLIFTSLLIVNACGQDWLEGGFVRSGDYGDIAQYFTDPIFYTNPISYQFRPGPYPGPYGVYPFNPEPYYSDFRLTSLAGMNWEPFQKNWSETMDYAKTRSSMRVYQNGAWLPP